MDDFSMSNEDCIIDAAIENEENSLEIVNQGRILGFKTWNNPALRKLEEKLPKTVVFDYK